MTQSAAFRWKHRSAAIAGMAVACASFAHAQTADTTLFTCGERLTYDIRTDKFGNVGSAVMALTGPFDVRGVETVMASLTASAGIAFLKGHDATRSWFDPVRMTSLRYQKIEKRPFASYVDSIEIYPGLRHWDGLRGDSGSTASDRPLDELAFLYFLRTLTLAPDSTYTFDRHYDKRRDPTTVRVVKHESLSTPAGTFNTVEYEMKVINARDFKSLSVLYVWVSEDRCRFPVRIESVMPLLGNGIMTLQTASSPNCPSLAKK
ncbi:MAG TPA: DUF3108 domain-containing protein [Gemmatimonadaceae bacterium]|nr:DUF3108 domain-containing protein [Gemmatimonadaceae bacterium]